MVIHPYGRTHLRNLSNRPSRTNKDLDPVPKNARKWGVTSFIAYWISDAFNAATWQFASSIIAIGLTYREAIGITALAFFIISFVIAFNGATGVSMLRLD